MEQATIRYEIMLEGQTDLETAFFLVANSQFEKDAEVAAHMMGQIVKNHPILAKIWDIFADEITLWVEYNGERFAEADELASVPVVNGVAKLVFEVIT